MAGFAAKVVERSGARTGDVLVVTGGFGLPSCGLRILTGGVKAPERFRRKAVESALLPSPSLRTGMALAPYLSSSMDSSDGLARSLHTLAGMSRVGFDVERLPVCGGVEAFARANGLDAERLVLYGGEEFVIVGTVRPDRFRKAQEATRRSGGDLIRIGTVTSSRRTVRLVSGGSRRISDEGWTHLG
jgi:thiamine-monophosphate kinase